MMPFCLPLAPYPLDGSLVAVPGQTMTPSALCELAGALGERVIAPAREGIDLASALATTWSGPLTVHGLIGFDADDVRALFEGTAGALLEFEPLAAAVDDRWGVPPALAERVARPEIAGVLVVFAGGPDLTLHAVNQFMVDVEALLPSHTRVRYQAFSDATPSASLLGALACVRGRAASVHEG